MARAMHSRCCWPPDSPMPEAFSATLTSSQSAGAACSARSTMSSMLPFMPATFGPYATFS